LDNTTIHQVIGIDGATLMVFYTEAHCWQFRLISLGGAVFGERKIYYSAEAALKAGLEWMAQGS
jgi:hypothetical protein